jgi:hypothetical protein
LKGRYKDEHAKWFDTFLTDGFNHAQKVLQDYASFTMNSRTFADLDADKQASVKKVNDRPKDYCTRLWVHP